MTLHLALPVHPTARHPLTGMPIRAVFVDKHGQARFPVMGGAPEGDEGEGDGGSSADGSNSGSGDGANDDRQGGDGKDLGFPRDTPVAEMNDKEQAAYWRHNSKKHESRASGLSKLTGGKTAEQIKAEHDELERLRDGQRTDNEKAVKAAEDKARAEERQSFGSQLVEAKFETALAHVDDERRNTIIASLNLPSYIGEDGKVDTDKVKKTAEALAPVDKTNQHRRDFGGGQRREGAQTRGAGGKAEAARRWPKQQTTTTPDR